ncbi:pPR-type GPCR protein [Phycomyces nitens]|nr:pPR-type GPCR protein [Phycomyces nitens]
MPLHQRTIMRESFEDEVTPLETIDSIKDTAALLGDTPRFGKTVSWSDLPAWLQDNIYITDGYRPPMPNYRDCFNSLFYLHNESVNIWSHLLAFFVFIGLGIAFLWNQPFADSLTKFDYAYFFAFILGALVCLGFSSSFHCLSCHSEPVAAAWNRCDYAGITSLIVGSFFPIIHYGFHCHKGWQTFYLVIITVLGAFTAVITLMKHFRTPAYRWIRTSLFLALGLFGIVPTLHGIYIYGFDKAIHTVSLANLLLMAVSYVTGALIYGHRIPERYYPGTFNIWFASHQIFHIFVVIALISHYLGVMRAMEYWHKHGNNVCLDFQ